MEKIKVPPTEYDMLIGDEEALLLEMDIHRAALIELEQELQVIRNKLAFIKVAVPENAAISSFQ